jgi:glycosyltransferase involved in cell wall biosynthesis
VADLERAARAAGVGLHGRLPREDVGRVLAGTDLLVVPSLWWENQPLVILEALAAGTPLAVSDLGGMAELVGEGTDGLRFPAGDVDALERLLRRVLEEPTRLDALAASPSAMPDVATATDLVELAYADALAVRRARSAGDGSR